MSVTPDFIGLGDLELPLQTVGRGHFRFATVIARAPTIAGLRTQLLQPHQAGHAVTATGLTQLTQVVVDLSVAVNTTTFQPRMLDQPEQTLIFLGAYGARLG
jgi:hypothetical protein